MSRQAARKLRSAAWQLDVVLDLMRQMADAAGIGDEPVQYDAKAAGEKLREALERLAERAEADPPPMGLE